MQKKIASLIIIGSLFIMPQISNSYFLGLKSRDNTIENIQRTEKKIGQKLPIVSFIFDPWNENAIDTIAKLPSTLGLQKIYHITVSPSATAKEVAEGKADDMYLSFFKLVKDLHLKVVFRTMHEMNGGWYPRGSDPKNFAKAWQRVRQLSRNIGLTKEDILFDMSVNGWDIPTREYPPNQQSLLMFCFPAQKQKLNCPTFEDYYPGDNYVDIMGFTFYNRGKGNSNRLWQTPYEIISHPQRKTLQRLKTMGKPLFIDEVGTTAVWYDGAYNKKRSQRVFEHNIDAKNERLDQLSDFLKNEPEIVGAIYFNIDLTYGLQNRMQGEADWSIIDPATNKIYEGGLRLINNATDNNLTSNALLDLFGVKRYIRGKKNIFLSKLYGKQALALLTNLKITDTAPYADAKKILDEYTNSINSNTSLSASQKKGKKYFIDQAYRIIAQ